MINEAEEEIDTLKAIYLDDFEVIGTNNSGFSINTKFKNDVVGVSLRYNFNLPPKYPHTVPSINVVPQTHSKDLVKFVDQQIKGLEDFLKHKATKQVGNVMIYYLMQEASEYLDKFLTAEEIKAFQKTSKPQLPQIVTVAPIKPSPVSVTKVTPVYTSLAPTNVDWGTYSIVSPYRLARRAAPPVAAVVPVAKEEETIKEYLERVANGNWPRFLRTNHGFTAFPEDVHKYGQSLCEIDMSYNQIPFVPPEISLIKNLSKLVLNNNAIKFLPIEIGSLVNLRVLELAKNALMDLPDTIVNLANLQVLQLEHNKIASLPANIGKLTALNCLDLQYNRIKYIPVDIAKLGNLNLLRLRSNPIVSPPPEVYHKGTDAILNYMKSHLGEFIAFGTSTLAGDLGKQLNDKRFSDFQFEVQGKTIYAHKCILQSICPQLLQNSDIVVITAWGFDAFYEFLYSLYTDTVRFSNLRNEIKEIAMHFEVTSLVNKLETMKDEGEELIPAMTNLWKDPVFPDVSFVSEEGQVIYANKVICARSEYFNAMFSFEKKSEKLEMSVSAAVLSAVLEFLYTDEIDNSIEANPDMILDLFATAAQYDLPRLKSICESIIGYNVDADNAACIYSLGVLHRSTPLINVCEYYITAHFKQVRYTEAYVSLDDETKQHFTNLMKQAVKDITK